MACGIAGKPARRRTTARALPAEAWPAVSLLATDTTAGSVTRYEHLYGVVKGPHVAWMVISFEQGDTSTDGDSAILANMAAHLP